MLEEFKVCNTLKLNTTTVEPHLMIDKTDSTALSHKKDLTGEAACSFPGTDIIYLILYCSARDVQHQITNLKHTQKTRKPKIKRQINKTRFRDNPDTRPIRQGLYHNYD